MSIIDLHIELSKANYFAELTGELDSVVKKKKEFLSKIESKNRTLEKLSPEEKEYLEKLIKQENEIIADFIKAKKWFNIPDDILKHFADEIQNSKSSK